jgi:general stress protein YciG
MAPKNKHAVALGRLGGKARAENLKPEQIAEIASKAGLVGGAARAKKLTPEQRAEIARKAAAARWGKKAAATKKEGR